MPAEEAPLEIYGVDLPGTNTGVAMGPSVEVEGDNVASRNFGLLRTFCNSDKVLHLIKLARGARTGILL